MEFLIIFPYKMFYTFEEITALQTWDRSKEMNLKCPEYEM